MTTRQAVYAGKFYPSDPSEAHKLIEFMEKKEANNLSHIKNEQVQVLGGVVPHAGLMFCGYEAIHFFHYIAKQPFDTVIILSPSHHGAGPEISMDSHDQWEIPGAVFNTDQELLNSGFITPCADAQFQEHAAEVMLPYLHYYRPDLNQIAVVTIRNPKLENAQQAAQALVKFSEQSGKKLLLIASSDFNHFEPPKVGSEKDDLVLEAIKNKDEAEVVNRVRQHNVSVCGYGPIVTLMAYARMKNNNARFSVLRRGHSGNVLPSDEVVDYVSLLCSVAE